MFLIRDYAYNDVAQWPNGPTGPHGRTWAQRGPNGSILGPICVLYSSVSGDALTCPWGDIEGDGLRIRRLFGRVLGR